jgi:DNA-binding MarR family transcriptional regulator
MSLRILAAISTWGPQTSTELVERLRSDGKEFSIRQAISRLIDANLVYQTSRNPEKDNRHGRRLDLTPQGHQIVAEVRVMFLGEMER